MIDKTYKLVPTLTPTVGRTCIELQALRAKTQITTNKILFMQQTLRFCLMK